MRDFAGAEPLVGVVRGLRTFRIDDTGALLPLYSDRAWYDGDNVAECAPPTGTHPRAEHPVPSGDCECGFYAYGSLAAIGRQRQSRFVIAVVAAWGNVVAGTLGFRAEHARIEALWVAPAAPTWVPRRLSVRYPSARVYADHDAMLGEFPLTELPCYEPVAPPSRTPASLATGAGALVLGLGLLPLDVLRTVAPLWHLWVLCTAVVAATCLWLLAGARWAGHGAAAVVMLGVLAWVVAPLFGLGGWLLRAPLLRGGAVAASALLLRLWPGYFPIHASPHERAFCGVRPSG